jgi:hypothetical protein
VKNVTHDVIRDYATAHLLAKVRFLNRHGQTVPTVQRASRVQFIFEDGKVLSAFKSEADRLGDFKFRLTEGVLGRQVRDAKVLIGSIEAEARRRLFSADGVGHDVAGTDAEQQRGGEQ